MNPRYLISLLCAGALAFACGPRSRTEPGTVATANATSATARPAESPKHAITAKGPKLDSRLKVNVEHGEVRFAFDVANVGKKHLELSFPSGKSYDIVVIDSVGREVWHWSSGRMFTQGVQNKQLGSGDSMNVAESWDKLPQSGVYTAIATLNSTNYPVEQRVDFVVP